MDNNFDSNSCTPGLVTGAGGQDRTGQDTQVNIGKLLRTKANITVGAWNVRTLNKKGSPELLLNELSKFSVDIVGLSEVRWIGTGVQTLGSFDFFYCGEDKHVGGVALMVAHKVKHTMIGLNCVSSRLIYARFKGQGVNLSVIQAYAPTSASSVEDLNKFYGDLQTTYDSVDKSDLLILMGDWNAKIGDDFGKWPTVLGKFGLPGCNENGLRLLEFCRANDLSITNTFFKHKLSRKWTWSNHDGSVKNMIDFVIVRNRWRSCVLNTRSFPSADVNSDHQLVMSNLRLRFAVRRRNRHSEGSSGRHDLDKFREPAVVQEFQQEVKQRLTSLKPSTLDEAAEDFSRILREVADKALGFRKQKKKPWISDITLALIEKRRKLRGVPSMKTSYNQLTHQIRHQINDDFESWCEGYCEEIETLQRTHQTRSMHQKIKTLLKGNSLKVNTTVINSKDGKILTTDEDLKGRWFEYCSSLYSHNLSVDPNILDPLWKDQPQESLPDILESEILDAISKMRNGKAAGIDGVPAEFISKTAAQLSLFCMTYAIEHGMKKNFLQFGANLSLYLFLKREILSYVRIIEQLV